MNCPFDDSPLQVVNRQGVEIDWCPSCKGVWLERGELDKLIEQAAAMSTPAPVPAYDDRARVNDDGRDRDRDDRDRDRDRPRLDDDRRRDFDDDDDDRHHGKRGKRRGFLSEIFDFD